MRNRQPAVAGQFYESDAESLRRQIEGCFKHNLGPGRLPDRSDESDSESVVATVNPHAGYMYSGPIAAHSFIKLSGKKSQLFVIIGPNHFGIGSGVAAPQSDEWITPLGSAKVDVKAARELMMLSRMVDMDDSAHWREHSIEVQVPFLQFMFGENFTILPISMAMQDKETAEHLGRSVASLLSTRSATLIASSDFTHYEPHKVAEERDKKAIELILSFDIDGFYRYIEEVNLTMCGFGPVASVMYAAKRLGAQKAMLLSYATSGLTGGDMKSVVGYASIAFVK
ncbi:MAG: MEMO1 family protein [Conexivisphaerales archaeon]